MLSKSNFGKVMGLLVITILFVGFGSLVGIGQSQAEEITKTITIDGEDVDEYNRFKGFGTVSGNNTSRLLLDYKEEYPDKYWEIMNQLFNKETGAGLAHVKVELGGDINSSSGTEPATMRYHDEPANVLRGAGFQFAADAKSINEDITTEILRWGEPRWSWEGVENGNYENRYQWYKQTIDAVDEEYGFKLDYVGISQNERAINNNGNIEVDWLKYFTTEIKEEPNYDEDYKDIKLVAADGYRDTSSISRVLLDDPELMDEIDVISGHYDLNGSPELTQLQDKLIDEGKEPKEVWVSEGVSPMINARYRENMQPDYNGIGGEVGVADVISRIISIYSWTGETQNPLHAVSFDFQPSVAAFYQGAQYNPKHLISAFDPWSGFYEADVGIQGVRHVMNFVGYDDRDTAENERWMYVNSATYSDGTEGDGGVVVDTSTHNYMTLKDPETDDYTTFFTNNTKDAKVYTIHTENLNGKENADIHVWETRGSEDGQAYDENWFKNIDTITPENESYQVEVQPYSIVTISTLDRQTEIEGFEYQSNPVDLSEDTIMSLPYEDDFEYDEYEEDDKGRDYVERRGGTPRYTTDQIGAFEVVKEATQPSETNSFERVEREIPNAEEHGNMLQQKMNTDIIGADWSVWGGADGSEADVNPNTNIGDFRWVNYKVSYDFLLDTYTNQVEDRENYASIGVRQVKADWSDSQAPYNARIYADGKYEILKLGNVVKDGEIESFDNAVWHHLAFEAKENEFTLYLDDEEIASYVDEAETVMAGRVTLGSGYYETLIDNLHIEPVEGYPYQSLKLDNAQGQQYASEDGALNNNDPWNPIGYVGEWDFIQSGYAHFNRTQMRTSTDFPVWNGVTVEHTDSTTEQGSLNQVYYSGDWGSNSGNAWGSDGDSFEITFEGNEIRLFGETNPSNGTADIYLDGELVGEASYLNNSSVVQMVWSSGDLEEGEHTLKVVAKESYTSFVRAEIETEEPLNLEASTNLAPNDFTAIADDSEIEDQENTVYAYRENGSAWGANSSNAWADFKDNPYILINFTGTGIDYLAGTGNDTTYHFELDEESVGEFDVGEDGIRYSVRELEEKQHTLKVSLGDNEVKEQYMDYRGVTIYHTPEESDNSFTFNFEGSGFNLFGATPDALMDVYIDDQLVDEDYRVYAKGDRQTSYSIRGLEKTDHTAKVVIRGGSYVLDGLDIITDSSPSDGEEDDSDDGDDNQDGDTDSDQLIAHYDMTADNGKLTDVTNNDFDATLVGFEKKDFQEEEDSAILNFTGDESKYVELPSGLIKSETFTIETTFSTETGADHWLYSIGTEAGDWPNVNNYIFLNPNQANDSVRFGIKDAETEILFQDASINKEEYNTFTASFEEGSISLYLNGVALGSLEHDYSIEDIVEAGTDEGAGFIGYIGKSLYNVDPAFTGKLKDFKVYNYALTSEDVTGLTEEEIVEMAKSQLVLSEDDVKEDIALPSDVEIGGLTTNIEWESSNPDLVSNNGAVNRPSYEEGNQEVVLTATITRGSSSTTKQFTINVVSMSPDNDLIEEALAAIKIPNINDVRGHLTLPTEGKNNTEITWESENSEIITTTGEVNRPARGEGDITVTLTATMSLNDQEITKEFVAKVKEMPKAKDYKGYLFSYFTGESKSNGEQIHFALSEGNNPLQWQQLNNGEPAIESKLGEEGLRDPFIIRSPEGDKFYMIATDLKIHGNGDWGGAQTSGSKSIMVWESTDLVNWSEQRLVEVAPPEAGNTWAPEIFYDKTVGEYVIFWASKLYDSEEDRNSGDSYQRMMYTTTRDFHTFSEPEVYLDYGYSIIDTTMIEHDGKIYRFTKDERGYNENSSPNGKFIFQEVGDSVLDSDFEMITEGIGKGIISQGEGPAIFKSNTEEKWYLFIDEFGGQGYVPFETTDLDSGEWTLSEDYDLPSSPRHGTVLPVTQEEYDALLANVPAEIEDNNDIPVTGLLIEEEAVELTIDEEVTINATIEPSDATNQELWFSSNEEGVATVSEDGIIKAIDEGEAIISVTTADGGFIATINVNVLKQTDSETQEEDGELELGKVNKVKAGVNYVIADTSSQLKMPADLPEGTTVVVEPREVGEIGDQEIKAAGPAFTFTVEYPEGEPEPTEDFVLVLGYETGADTDQIAIYYYNEETEWWEDRGGEIDNTNNVISISVPHFSSYGVFAEIQEDEKADEDPNDNPPNSDTETPNEGEREQTPNEEDSTTEEEIESSKGESDNSDKKTPTNEKENKDDQKISEEKLPDTATNTTNYILISIIFLIIGVVLLIRKRKI